VYLHEPTITFKRLLTVSAQGILQESLRGSIIWEQQASNQDDAPIHIEDSRIINKTAQHFRNCAVSLRINSISSPLFILPFIHSIWRLREGLYVLKGFMKPLVYGKVQFID